MRKLAWLSRYSMPKTESNLPALTKSSLPRMGVTRPKACSSSTMVWLPLPGPPKRGKSCSRVNAMMGALGAR